MRVPRRRPALADDHELGGRVAGAEDDRRSPFAQLAAATALQLALLAGERVLGPLQILAAQRDLGDAQVAMMAERGGEGGERARERIGGSRLQVETRRGCAARSASA